MNYWEITNPRAHEIRQLCEIPNPGIVKRVEQV